MSRHKRMGTTTGMVLMSLVLSTFLVRAHPMTIKGTVASVERTRIQVKTGDEKKGEAPTWYPIDAKTRIMRDKTVVKYEQAKIKSGERVVLNVDHEADGTMKTVEIRLAAQ